MKLKTIIFFTIIALLSSSCFFEPLVLPCMGVEIEKTNLKVGEKTEVICYLSKIHYDKNNSTIFTVYFKGLPENCKIIEGEICDPSWSDGTILCVMPKQIKGMEARIVMEIAFDKPGEYELIANGCYLTDKEIGNIWTEGIHNYKFTVTE